TTDASFDLSSVDLGACGLGNDCSSLGGTCVSGRCRTTATDLMFVGSGVGSPVTCSPPATCSAGAVLRMNGTVPTGQTWYLFKLAGGVSEIAFRDLTLDGSMESGGSAVSLIQLGVGGASPEATHTSLDTVTLQNSKNNGVQMWGAVSDVSIRASKFE